MKLSKQEIEEELAHKRQIVVVLVRRRRPLELQAAQKGLSVPPEIRHWSANGGWILKRTFHANEKDANASITL